MNHKQLMLTFDYELFLGAKSGSIERCLKQQTELLLACLKKYRAVSLFFIDASFLLKLQNDHSPEKEKYIQLIQRIASEGHDIGLHLHPHWLDAQNIGDGCWELSNQAHFRLHSLDEDDLALYFEQALQALNKVVHQVKPHYQINSFRAGGWCIEPFSKLKALFKKHQILFDFSVLPGHYIDHRPLHFHDSRLAPRNKGFWRFEVQTALEDKQGSFYEIPVSAYKSNPIWILLNYYFYVKAARMDTNGQGASLTSWKERLGRLLKPTRHASLDGISKELSSWMFMQFKQKDFLCLASHPKGFTPDSFLILEKLLAHYQALSLKELQEMIHTKNNKL